MDTFFTTGLVVGHERIVGGRARGDRRREEGWQEGRYSVGLFVFVLFLVENVDGALHFYYFAYHMGRQAVTLTTGGASTEQVPPPTTGK